MFSPNRSCWKRSSPICNSSIMSATRPLFIALLLTLLSGCQGREESIKPTRMDLAEAVYASVRVEPDSMYHVHSAVGGILKQHKVSEGMSVKPGDVLLEIDATSPRYNAENARLQMELAQSNYTGASSPLKELAAQIRTAELTYKDDSVNYARQQKLWNQNIGSKSEYERKQLAVERSRNQLQRLKSEHLRLSQELQTQMIQKRNAYAAAKADTEEFTIQSQINGKVYALYLEPGELVQPNQPLAMIGSPDTFIAELRVDEVDIVRLREGQRTLIRLDAYGETVFEAIIDKIYPEKDTRSQTFLVEARFNEIPDRLYPGLTGEANIIIASRSDVLTIPRNYLMGPDSVRTRKGFQKIETGLLTLDRVEVLSGLEDDTEILKPDP